MYIGNGFIFPPDAIWIDFPVERSLGERLGDNSPGISLIALVIPELILIALVPISE
jgi:hypothetical protein